MRGARGQVSGIKFRWNGDGDTHMQQASQWATKEDSDGTLKPSNTAQPRNLTSPHKNAHLPKE